MSFKSKNNRGFTLVELMVVMVIITIMSGVVVVGFKSFSDTVKVQEMAGVIGDRLDQFQLEVVNGQFQKTTVDFLPEYGMAISEVKDPELSLEIKAFGGLPCLEDEFLVSLSTDGGPAYLNKTDEKGNTLEVIVFDGSDMFCVDFLESENLAWNFQAEYDGKRSNALRFFHFNIDRDDLSDPLEIVSGLDYQVIFESPYGQRRIYQEGEEVLGEASLFLENSVEGVEWNLKK